MSLAHEAREPGVPEGNRAGFGGSAVTSGIIERETKQTWEEARGGTKDKLPLPPGLLCFSALCIHLPQTRLAGAQLPCSLNGAAYPALRLGSSDPGARGDRQTASDCWLLDSVLMDFTLPCSSTSSASCGTRDNVTRGVCCPEQNKGTVAQRSSREHQELPCPVGKAPMFNFPLAKEAASKKTVIVDPNKQLTHFLFSHYQKVHPCSAGSRLAGLSHFSLVHTQTRI